MRFDLIVINLSGLFCVGSTYARHRARWEDLQKIQIDEETENKKYTKISEWNQHCKLQSTN